MINIKFYWIWQHPLRVLEICDKSTVIIHFDKRQYGKKMKNDMYCLWILTLNKNICIASWKFEIQHSDGGEWWCVWQNNSILLIATVPMYSKDFLVWHDGQLKILEYAPSRFSSAEEIIKIRLNKTIWWHTSTPDDCWTSFD